MISKVIPVKAVRHWYLKNTKYLALHSSELKKQYNRVRSGLGWQALTMFSRVLIILKFVKRY